MSVRSRLRFNLRSLIILQRSDISFRFVGRFRLEKEGGTKGGFTNSIQKNCHLVDLTVSITNKEETRGSRDKVMESEWIDIMENSEP